MTKRFALNDKTISAAKAKNAPRTVYALTDGQGLYLEVDHAKAKSHQWRFQFKSPTTGKRNRLSFGDYPTVSIANARQKAQEAREQMAEGVDPAAARDSSKAVTQAHHAAVAAAAVREAAGLAPVNSFEDLANRLQAENANRWVPSYTREFELTIAKYALPAFGRRHVATITPMDIEGLNELLKAEGKMQMLIKLRRFVRHVFDYAIEPPLSLIQMNPVVKKRTLFDGVYKKPRPAATTGDDARKLMQAIRSWDVAGNPSVRNALLLQAWVFQRPANIAQARKEHFNLDAGTWTIPAVMMKGRRLLKEAPDAKPHLVYLSTQAVAMLREQFAAFPDADHVFPNQRNTGGHMGHDSMNDALGRLGFAGKHCAHGFRAMARTICEDELEFNPLHLERALAHKRATGLDGANLNHDAGLGVAYARAQSLKQRFTIAQAWADYLDELCKPVLRLAA